MKTRSSSVRHQLQFFDEYLRNPEYTEICVNEPGRVWTYGETWESHSSDVTEIDMESLAIAVSVFNDDKMTARRPIMTARLHRDEGGHGERIHITRPPVTENHTLTIRKPSSTVISIDQYRESGFFDIAPPTKADNKLRSLYDDKQYGDFLTMAVAMNKTIVVSGSTGCGKTTFLRTLMRYIPADSRVLTCEDVGELECEHANCVAKFFKSTGKKDDNFVTADDIIRSSLRMLPSRIICGELRGGECMSWLQAVATGHGGSLVTVHAGSVVQTFQRLELMGLMSDIDLPHAALQSLVESVVDVVVHIGSNRRITDVYYRS